MIYTQEPAHFNPKFEVVSCFVECNGEILLLHRQDHKPQGNTWGLPAGKVDEGEDPLETIQREVEEETGLAVFPHNFHYLGKVYVRYPEYDFLFHIFHTTLEQKQTITINPNEHKNFIWILPQQILTLPFIGDLDTCVKLFYPHLF